MKKFKLTENTILFEGKRLYQIEAVRDFWEIKKGDLGGFVEKEENLSHQGDCWIYPEAMVMDDALVKGDAWLYPKSLMKNQAIIDGFSRLMSHSILSDTVEVTGSSVIQEDCLIFGNAKIDCGEDGPLIPARSFINFDVSYSCQMVQLILPYIGKLIHISEAGQICFDGWSGTLESFEKEVSKNYADWEEMIFAYETAKLYISIFKKSYRHGNGH